MILVCRYAKESKVLFKVAGYADSARQQSHMGLVELHDQPSAGCMPPTGELYFSTLYLSPQFLKQRWMIRPTDTLAVNVTCCSVSASNSQSFKVMRIA